MPLIISHKNKKIDKQLSKLGSQIVLVDETDAREAQIVLKIREQYSLSEELALHRKQMIGALDKKEWDDYVDYVTKCIADVDSNTQVDE